VKTLYRGEQTEGAKGHRLVLDNDETVEVTAEEQPVAMWVPSNCTVRVLAPHGAVLDFGELVQHHDVVSLERTIREHDKRTRIVKRALRRAKRRLRGLERPDRL
jgi:hypothetical protein